MPDTETWLLAIDTATDQAGVALFNGSAVVARSWPGGRQQTTTVLPQIESMARDAGVSLDDVGAVAVSIGPGSFTGLRVGLSIAKGFALARGCALIGVPTLEIVSRPFAEAGVRCVAVAPAGRGRVVWARFGVGEVGAARNSSLDEFAQELADSAATMVVGELDAAQRKRLAEAGIPVAMVTLGFRQPGVLAELGWRRWQDGQVEDPVLLEPAYLHGRPNPR